MRRGQLGKLERSRVEEVNSDFFVSGTKWCVLGRGCAGHSQLGSEDMREISGEQMRMPWTVCCWLSVGGSSGEMDRSAAALEEDGGGLESRRWVGRRRPSHLGGDAQGRGQLEDELSDHRDVFSLSTSQPHLSDNPLSSLSLNSLAPLPLFLSPPISLENSPCSSHAHLALLS